jgi:hypothetical protein
VPESEKPRKPYGGPKFVSRREFDALCGAVGKIAAAHDALVGAIAAAQAKAAKPAIEVATTKPPEPDTTKKVIL